MVTRGSEYTSRKGTHDNTTELSNHKKNNTNKPIVGIARELILLDFDTSLDDEGVIDHKAGLRVLSLGQGQEVAESPVRLRTVEALAGLYTQRECM